MSVDQWVGVEAGVPPHIQPESPDANLDYYYAMPELVSFRREELRGMIALGAASDHVDDSPRTNRSGELPRSRGIAERLNELGRKARGSIASLMGRKDSLVKEGVYSPRGLVGLADCVDSTCRPTFKKAEWPGQSVCARARINISMVLGIRIRCRRAHRRSRGR